MSDNVGSESKKGLGWFVLAVGLLGGVGGFVVGSERPDIAPTRTEESNANRRRTELVSPMCLIVEDTVVIHVGISTSTGDTLWSLSCDRSTRKCEGQLLDLKPPIGILNIMDIKGATLVVDRDTIATIDYPPLRSFQLDMTAGTVTYSEVGRGMLSGETVDSRGIGLCE